MTVTLLVFSERTSAPASTLVVVYNRWHDGDLERNARVNVRFIDNCNMMNVIRLSIVCVLCVELPQLLFATHETTCTALALQKTCRSQKTPRPPHVGGLNALKCHTACPFFTASSFDHFPSSVFRL